MYALLIFFVLAGLTSIYTLHTSQDEYTAAQYYQKAQAAGLQAYRTALQTYLTTTNPPFTGDSVTNTDLATLSRGYKLSPSWKNIVDPTTKRFIVYVAADPDVVTPSFSAELARVSHYSQLAGEVREKSPTDNTKMLFSPAPDVIGKNPHSYISLEGFISGAKDLPINTPVWIGTY